MPNRPTRVLALDRRFRDSQITFAERNGALGELRSRWDKAAAQAEKGAINPKSRRQCESLRLAGDPLWTFLSAPAIEPTNNVPDGSVVP